jgi:hypothetical protein
VLRSQAQPPRRHMQAETEAPPFLASAENEESTARRDGGFSRKQRVQREERAENEEREKFSYK